MKQFFLFQKGAKGLSIPRQVSFWLYHGVLYLLANVGLGIGSLWFATGEYGQTMFDSYFEFPTLIWLNVLPVVLLGLLQGAEVPALVILCCETFPTRTASASSIIADGPQMKASSY